MCDQIPDIYPKRPPSPDKLSDSLEKSQIIERIYSPEKEEKESTFRDDIDNSAEYYKLKEKLMDTEDLAQMYKTDLAKLQVKYLEVTEQKEEMILRISAILFSNREMNKILNDSKRNIEELTVANFSLTEDVEAYKSQNECLKSSIREIQDSLIKLEREYYKNKKYIETLESGNTVLVASNHTLKFELEKSRKNEEGLELKLKVQKDQKRPEIYMNPKLAGDVESSYNISISDSETEKSCIDEEEKNVPNLSMKFNHNLSISNEFSLYAIPTMEISKPEKITENIFTFKGDNFLWYRHFLKSKEGLIFEDDKIQIGLKVNADNNICWGKMSISNKTLVGIELNLILISYPEGLSSLMLPTGQISILPSAVLCFQVYAELTFAYNALPLLKLSYRNTLSEKFIRIPLTYPLFFIPFADKNACINEPSSIKYIKKLYKGAKTMEDFINLSTIHQNFTFEMTSTGTFFIRSQTPLCPIQAQITINSDDSANIEVKCREKNIQMILLGILSNQLENI